MSFKPCCDKLKVSLQDTLLSNPDHEVTAEENAFDVEAEEIVECSEDIEECEKFTSSLTAGFSMNYWLKRISLGVRLTSSGAIRLS